MATPPAYIRGRPLAPALRSSAYCVSTIRLAQSSPVQNASRCAIKRCGCALLDVWVASMTRFVLKPILWNTEGYLRPSGVRANSGYPHEHGYGHEEWNNSPRMAYERSGLAYRAFHTERIGGVPPPQDDPIVIFLYASHHGVQQLVGAAAEARCLIDREDERTALIGELGIRNFWREAWRLPGVQSAYTGEKAFLQEWKANCSWIPNWTCLASMFFQPDEPVTLDPVNIRGTSKLLTMFGQHTSIDAAASVRVLTSVPYRLRTQEWQNVAEFVVRAGSLSDDAADGFKNLPSAPDLDRTTKQALIAARRGQGQFREQVAERWGRTCAVSGCAQEAVLRASHIKPWRASCNRERLDSANGLLLAANLDALFDRGLLTFDDQGQMLISRAICTKDRTLLGVPARLRRKPKKDERVFLNYCREQIFRS